MDDQLLWPQQALSEEEMARLQAGMFALLQKRARYMTQGDSASLREETVQEMLLSIRYTLAFGLRQRGANEAALAELPLQPLFDEGLAAIRQMVEETKRLYELTCAATPRGLSRSLDDTLQGLGLFFRQYDPAVAAHETPVDVDYQLCLPVDEALCGVLHVREYLLRLMSESRLLAAVEPAVARRTLTAFLPEHRLLVANLYEPVMANAVARAMLGLSARKPSLAEGELSRVEGRLRGLDEPALREALCAAATRAAAELTLDAPSTAYLRQAAAQLAPRVMAALPQGGLAGVFPVASGLEG